MKSVLPGKQQARATGPYTFLHYAGRRNLCADVQGSDGEV